MMCSMCAYLTGWMAPTRCEGGEKMETVESQEEENPVRNMGNRVSSSYSFLVAVANFIAGIVFCMRT